MAEIEARCAAAVSLPLVQKNGKGGSVTYSTTDDATKLSGGLAGHITAVPDLN